MIAHIKVLTRNLTVDKFYFSFDYIIYWNGKFKNKGTYESDHDWEDLEAFKKSLNKEGMALLALEQIEV